MMIRTLFNRAFLAAFAAGFLWLISPDVRGDTPKSAAPASQPVEAWSQRLPGMWPQLVLTNEATFDQHSALHGASAFLMRMPDGEIVVGTARHLIGDAGGVKPAISLLDLDRALKSWQVFPRTREDRAIDAKGLAEDVNRESDSLRLPLLRAV